MVVSDQELTALAATHDIITLGMRADEVRRQRHGNRTTFVRVAEMPVAPEAAPELPLAAGEVRIMSTPATRAAATAAVARAIGVLSDAARPHIAPGPALSAFSLDELEDVAARDGCTLRALLEEFAAAGLDLVAEAPFDRLKNARRSVEEVNIAGLTLARLTMHQSPSADPVPTLKAVAELQRAVGVVRAFAPLPRRVNPAAPTTGYEDVKHVALARIIVSAVPSIQVDWSLYGPKLAQVALTVGADDIDGVSAVDDMSQGRRRAPLEEILRNISAAGQEPVERNGRFEVRPVAAS